MAEEPDNLVLHLLRTMRAENSARFDAIDGRFNAIERLLNDVRLTVAGYDLRFDALEERIETIREGTVSAIGCAANAGRAQIELRRQIEDLTRRVERLEDSPMTRTVEGRVRRIESHVDGLRMALMYGSIHRHPTQASQTASPDRRAVRATGETSHGREAAAMSFRTGCLSKCGRLLPSLTRSVEAVG